MSIALSSDELGGFSMRQMNAWTGALFCAIGIGACTSEAKPDSFSFDLGSAKNDAISSARIIDKIPLNSKIEGRFNRTVKTYGFTFEAKAGARITVGVATRAGADSTDTTAGAVLDTVSVIHGPVQGNNKGPRLVTADDDGSRVDAQLPSFEVPTDGEYVVAFSSWNDPGDKGSYTVNVGCEGTDFQCSRPIQTGQCNPQTLFVQGGQPISTDTTWDNCEVVLLENTIVEESAILTVRPGVSVKGNFIAGATTQYGTVGLEVRGQIQAVGVKDQPILFGAFKSDLGWKGLTLAGSSSSLENVFVENAETGILATGGKQTMTDLSVSRCDQGIVLRGGQDNNITRVKINQSRNGIVMSNQATGQIVDSVIEGVDKTGVGITLESTAAPTHFERSFVTGFATGVQTLSAELLMNDSTIVGNGRGVYVTSTDAAERGVSTCGQTTRPSVTLVTLPPPVVPSGPVQFRVDPVFTRCDIARNDAEGVYIDAPQLLVIEDSNLVGNGKEGLSVFTRGLAPESRIRRTNITDNNQGENEISALQQQGVLDITGNYWGVISDPELSQSWNTHFAGGACPAETLRIQGPSTGNARITNFNGWSCPTLFQPPGVPWGPLADNSNQIPPGWFVTCTISLTGTPFDAQVNMTGFSPVPLSSAGPQEVNLCEAVSQERQQSGF